MQFFAVAPAAGQSRRMGQPKLLLPMTVRSDAGSRTSLPLISLTLRAWQAARLDAVVTVVRKGDLALAAACRAEGAVVIQPEEDPLDMKASVWLALEFLRQEFSPAGEDCWMLAPADMPLLPPAAIRALMDAYRASPGRIVAPTCCGKRAHPTAFPWSLAQEVVRLGPKQGVKSLLERFEVVELPRPDTEALGAFTDVDTPEQYQKVQAAMDELLTDESENP